MCMECLTLVRGLRIYKLFRRCSVHCRNRICTVGGTVVEPSIFLDFHLPNAATWFYFSLFLTVALFFQFTRLLSIRNLDLLMLFLLRAGVPDSSGVRGPVRRERSSLRRRGVRTGCRSRASARSVTGGCSSARCSGSCGALLDIALVRRPP